MLDLRYLITQQLKNEVHWTQVLEKPIEITLIIVKEKNNNIFKEIKIQIKPHKY